VKVPCSAISFAACIKPLHAVRASEPPTLIRRTPRSAASATLRPEAPIKQVDRLRMHGFYHGRDLLFGLDTGRIEAIGAGFGIGLKPVDHHGQIGLADQKALAASGQHTSLLSASIATRDALMRSIAKARS